MMEEEVQIISRIRQGEKIKHFETARRRKDGSTFLASITISPVKNKKGEIIGASKIARDVTQTKMLEEKQELLSSIIESFDDAIISKNLNGIITSWNNGAQNIFGYHAAEAIGRHISLIIPPGRLHEELMIIKQIKSGGRLRHFKTVRCTKDGRDIEVSITVSPVKNYKNEIIGASKIARDITERRELEARRKLLSEKG